MPVRSWCQRDSAGIGSAAGDVVYDGVGAAIRTVDDIVHVGYGALVSVRYWCVRLPVLLFVCWLYSYQVYCRVCGYCLATLTCHGPHSVMGAAMGASHTLLESEETKPKELVRITQSRVRVGCPRWAPGPNTGYSVGSQAALCLPRWSSEDMSMWEIEDE